MKIAVYSTKPYDREFLEKANASYGHELVFLESRLTLSTASLAKGFKAICIFVNDEATAEVLEVLREGGTEMIALRCAGFNNVDMRAARKLEFCVARVPAYSPYAVAEHAVGLMMVLNRRIHRAFARVREANFALNGLLGFDMHGRTVGVVGTGKIGRIVCQIVTGFGCKVLAYDRHEDQECLKMGVKYVEMPELLNTSDIVTLHCPLTPETKHLINSETLSAMKDGVMIINTSRGALIDTEAVIPALKSGKVGFLGLDVYEEEADLFFEDLSSQVLQDDTFARLLTFPNVIITGHQAYFTAEALQNIADTTLSNVTAYEKDNVCQNAIFAEKVIHA